MYEIESVMEQIVKSRRRELHDHLSNMKRRHSRDARAMPLTDLHSRRKSGRIVLLLSAPKSARTGRDFFVVTDELWEDGTEVLQSSRIDETEVLAFLGVGVSSLPTYDPEREYIVNREKAGRPRRTLTPAQEREIRALHADGMGINALALRFHVSNRRIIKLLNN